MPTGTHRPLPTALAQAFRAARSRTDAIFALAAPEAYYERPIALRHPIAFYDGHLDAFAMNTLLAGVLGMARFAPSLDALFARGIDPGSDDEARERTITTWPSRQVIEDYKREVNARLYGAIATVDPAQPPHPSLKDGGLFQLVLEHELMHQETLLYLLHELPHALKRPPAGLAPPDVGPAPAAALIEVPEGTAVLGAAPGEFEFGWDNEFPRHERAVAAFAIDAYPVTNAAYLAFVEEGGYRAREFWDDAGWAWRERRGVAHPHRWRHEADGWWYRDVFEDRPLPPAWPAYVTQLEARAFARYAGRSLPSEAEWHRAAFGDHQDWPYPWGHAAPGPAHGAFDFQVWGPTRVGAHPAGASPLGVHELVGNGWEWTGTPFAPFEGFVAHPQYEGYSTDFFDGRHYVLKGGSCFTAAALLRRSFRNWYYEDYPYPYAKFRLVTR